MAGSKLLAACCVLISIGACGQSSALVSSEFSLQASSAPSSSPPDQTPSVSNQSSSGQSSSQANQADDQSQQGESSSRRGHHHVRVPLDTEESEPEALRDAEAAIDQQNYAEAETHLRKFVEEQPTSFVGWFDLGFVENALGKVDQSIDAYRKSVAAKPDVFESNLNLGLQLAKTGQPDAEKFLRAATQLKPTSHADEGEYRAWLGLAEVVAKSNPEEAVQAYRRAIELQPKEAEPHLSLGQLFESEKKFADAEKQYREAASLDPHSADAVTGLANVCMRAGRFPEAEDYLRKLIAQQPGSAADHIQLGRVLAAEGKMDSGIAELKAGTKLAPQDEAARLDLAQLCTKAGKNELAESEYRALLTLHPDDAELHRRLGESLLSEKKFAEAQQEFTAAVRLKADLGEAYGGLAFAAGENKNYALVIQALDARAKLLPEVPITHFMRASAYDHLRDFKKAAQNYRLFLNGANGKYPDEEWQARHRLLAIEPKK
jgi:Tfp pilus assembly protein PilF